MSIHNKARSYAIRFSVFVPWTLLRLHCYIVREGFSQVYSACYMPDLQQASAQSLSLFPSPLQRHRQSKSSLRSPSLRLLHIGAFFATKLRHWIKRSEIWPLNPVWLWRVVARLGQRRIWWLRLLRFGIVRGFVYQSVLDQVKAYSQNCSRRSIRTIFL